MIVNEFRVAAIVLAAGKSRRMGESKLTMPFGESTMIGSVVQALSNSRVSTVTVVLGYYGVPVRDALTDFSVEFAVNRKPDMGMLSSVQTGMKSVGEADAYLICLGDQPHISPDVVDSLIDRAESSDKGLFIPTNEGKRGHPLLIKSGYREELLALRLTEKLSDFISRHEDDLEEVKTADPGVTEDIDTPEDYQRLLPQTPS